MSSKISIGLLLNKITHCKRLKQTEIDFVVRCYEDLRRSYYAALAQCDEAEKAAIALSESQCVVEAQRMETDYRLGLRLDEKLASSPGGKGRNPSRLPSVASGLAYKVCLACYYETQMENMLITQDLPLSAEFLSALSALEAALSQVNEVAQKSRPQRMWAN